MDIIQVSIGEKHKRYKFSPQMGNIFPFRPTYSQMRNERIKIINSSCWYFSAWIVVPKEQHESWIKIITHKACKTLKNKREKQGFALGEFVERITSEQSVWAKLPIKWHNSHENKLWNHAKEMILLALLSYQKAW